MVEQRTLRARMRFSEMDSMMPNQLDFVPRERRNQVSRLIVAFVATMLLVFVAAYMPLFSHMDIYAPLLAILLVALLCLYTVYKNQVNLDLVMSTEYQNMLFAEAASLGSSFCMFVRRDGTIVHASNGLSKIFPQFNYSESQALEGIFEQGVIRKIDRERVMGAIRSGSTDHLIFPILDRYQERKDYILTIEPLPRPSGFSVVRGREYLGQRAGSQMLPDMLRSTTVDKLDHMLSSTAVALYTTDAYGRFEYVNPAFELMFDYEPGQIIESKLSLHHLVFSMGEQVVTEESTLHDYAGEATLIQRNGSRIKLNITQIAMRDSMGKVVGATGTILPVTLL